METNRNRIETRGEELELKSHESWDSFVISEKYGRRWILSTRISPLTIQQFARFWTLQMNFSFTDLVSKGFEHRVDQSERNEKELC